MHEIHPGTQQLTGEYYTIAHPSLQLQMTEHLILHFSKATFNWMLFCDMLNHTQWTVAWPWGPAVSNASTEGPQSEARAVNSYMTGFCCSSVGFCVCVSEGLEIRGEPRVIFGGGRVGLILKHRETRQ